MYTNHIHLMMSYINRLMDLAMTQRWLDGAREAASTNQEVQLNLDRYQSQIDAKKEEINNEMFEISRSN